MPGRDLDVPQVHARVETGRERFTNHVEYVSSQDGPIRLPALVAASLTLPWLHQAVLRCNRSR